TTHGVSPPTTSNPLDGSPVSRRLPIAWPGRSWCVWRGETLPCTLVVLRGQSPGKRGTSPASPCALCRALGAGVEPRGRGVRGREARAILRLLPEACWPLTQGLPLPLSGCAAPTLPVETRASGDDHSPSGGRRGGNLVRRGCPPRQRVEGLRRTTVGPWSISRGGQQECLPRHTGRRGRTAR